MYFIADTLGAQFSRKQNMDFAQTSFDNINLGKGRWISQSCWKLGTSGSSHIGRIDRLTDAIPENKEIIERQEDAFTDEDKYPAPFLFQSPALELEKGHFQGRCAHTAQLAKTHPLPFATSS